MSRRDVLLVVAIDFGTTYSGFAIQFQHEYDPRDPTKIRAPQPWNGGKQNLMSYKTPTCLLLDKNKQIDSFGFEAEERYAELCMNGENKEYYYYRRFKMRLQEGEGLKKDSMLEDETEKQMRAIDVFALSIQCLRQKLLEMINNEGTGNLEDKDVLWVLTVPAIWDDAAKGFMKEAAVEAGIKEEHLTIALEPEAASLFCQYLPVEKLADSQKNAFSKAKPGTVYMVADLGGGTADITVHEKLEDNKIKEVYKASGGAWGGTAVDEAFWQFLISIVGNPAMAKFKRVETYDHLELLKEFECVKRTLGSKNTGWCTIKLPASLNEICKTVHGETFKELVDQSPHKDKMNIVSDKLRIMNSLVETMFSAVTDKIVQHIKGIIETTDAGRKVSLVLMVGGFSESPYVQKQLKEGLKDKVKILIPQQPGLAVLNGAVLYGRMPESITTRILRYTYGVKIAREFREGVDDEAKRDPNNPKCCIDVFKPFMKEGTSVERGKKVVDVYTTSTPNQELMSVRVFTAKGDIPKYVTDSNCKKLGTLTVKVPNPSPEKHNLIVIFRFGSTSLAMFAIEEQSKKACIAAFSLQE